MMQGNVKIVMIVAVSFVLGCVVGGKLVFWRMNRVEPPNAHNEFAPGPSEQAVNQTRPASREIQPTSSRSVVISGQRLSDQDVHALERSFRGQIRDGNYWYDRMNGSWGRDGGPTEGFVMAGLNLGAPLREDASRGDTGVFINGRQLHRVDVARLMQLGPVSPGRCWMDAQGNIGLEGQPPFANVWVAAAQAQRGGGGGGGRREGILSTYDKTGIAVFGN